MAQIETEIRQAFERHLATMPARPDLRPRIMEAVRQQRSRPAAWRVAAASAGLLLVGAVAFYALVARHGQPAPIISPTPTVQTPAPSVASPTPTATPTATPTPQAGVPGTPGARLGAAMAWDEKDGYLLLFGGAYLGPSGNVPYDDTWAWTGREWKQLSPTNHPPGRTFGAMAFDRGSQRVLLFGGGAPNSDPGRNDTWAWDGSTWTELRPTDIPLGGTMVFDPDLPGLVMVGEESRVSTGRLATWTWTGANWKQLHPSTNVTSRGGFGLAYFDGLGVLMVGGSTGLAPDTERNDVWLFKEGGWSLRDQATHPIPGWCVIAYDAARRALVLFSFGTNQTWTYDGSTWVRRHPLHSPTDKLSFTAMAYDPVTQQVVMFGGKTDSVARSPYLNETWIWQGNDWQKQ
jgi:hypothetical protein